MSAAGVSGWPRPWHSGTGGPFRAGRRAGRRVRICVLASTETPIERGSVTPCDGQGVLLPTRPGRGLGGPRPATEGCAAVVVPQPPLVAEKTTRMSTASAAIQERSKGDALGRGSARRCGRGRTGLASRPHRRTGPARMRVGAVGKHSFDWSRGIGPLPPPSSSSTAAGRPHKPTHSPSSNAIARASSTRVALTLCNDLP